VNVHVAELVAGGIQVYTDDTKAAGTAESPNAQNGWNTILYKADQKHVGADLKVVVSPNASNSWNQLVVQNGKRAVSVLIVDWQRVDQ
jgi:hypothetical protein